jgi:hypothetical protein
MLDHPRWAPYRGASPLQVVESDFLIYAYDVSAGRKNTRVQDLIRGTRT